MTLSLFYFKSDSIYVRNLRSFFILEDYNYKLTKRLVQLHCQIVNMRSSF